MPRHLTISLLVLIFCSLAFAQAPTTTVIEASPNPSNYSQPVTLTATVTAGATGKITFYDGFTILGVATLSDGQARLTTLLPQSGTRKLRAYYQGDVTFTASSSTITQQTVTPVISPGLVPATTYPSSYNTAAIAVGDLNGDNMQDVVLVNKGNNSITVFLNNGDGTFQSGGSYGADSNPISAAIGDFNQDGKPDLVVANSYNAGVSILLGKGDGTFQTSVNLPLTYSPNAVTVADFNNDGKPDVATLSSSGIAVLLGNGDGTFQSAVFTASYFGVAFAVSDSNGDGFPDLIVTEPVVTQVGYVSSLLGNGDGTFQLGQQAYLQYGVKSASVADLNGDGISDVLLATNCCYGTMLLGNADGTFQTKYGNYFQSGPMIVADINGDGLLDATQEVPGNSASALQISLGTGPATFQSPFSYQAPGGFDLLAVGDLNGDGKLDVILASSTNTGFSVLLGGAAPDLTIAADRESGFTQGQQGAEYILRVGNSGQAATLGTVNVSVGLAASLSATTLSGSGWTCTPATVTCTRSDALAVGSLYPPIILNVNVANGATGSVGNTFTVSGGGESNLSNDTVIDTAFLRLLTTTTVTASANPSTLGQPVVLTATVTAGATGRIDFYSGTTQLGSAFLAAGKSVFTTSLLPAGSQKLYAYYEGDANYGPSRAALSQTVASVPSNGLSVSAVTQLSGQPTLLLSGDLNGDGKADLVAAYTLPGSTTVVGLLGNGDGTFRAPGPPVTVASAATGVLGDFNHDGKTDLVLLAGLAILFLPGNGDGSFAAAQQISSTGGTGYLFAADFNRDGNLDLLAPGSAGSSVIYLGNGAGGFQPPITVIPNSGYQQFAIADMNGDGVPDIVASGFIANQAAISVFLGNGDGSFTLPINKFPVAAVGSLAVADFNGDGKPDVAIEYTSIYVFSGNGDGTLADPTVVNQFAPGSMLAGDFNGDGKEDFFFPATYGASALFGNGNGTFQSLTSLNNVPSGPIAQADFNGDGKPDFAIAASQAQTIQVFLGGQFSGVGVSSTHFGQFTSGATGAYRITVSNPGFSTTTAGVTITDALPAGLTAKSIAGLNWNCTLTPLQCTRGDTIGSGASYPPIALQVSVAPGLGPATLINHAAVTYNGIVNSSNDSTTVVPPTTTTLQVSPSPVTLGQPVTLTATVTAGATGTVLFSDSGISLASAKVVNGQATLTTRQLPAGTRYLVAAYSGDATHGAGSSAETNVTVQASPTSGFANALTFATATSQWSIASGDFNNDGVTDLVSAGGSTISVLMGRGDGTFSPHTDYPAGLNPVGIAVADFNNDGKSDIAVTDYESNGFASILLGNGDGTFQPAITISFSEGAVYLIAADFNGDGKTDLVAGGGLAGFILLLGNGDGTFQSGVSYGGGYAGAAGDFNRDGKVDVATGSTILLGNGDGTFQTTDLGNCGCYSVVAGDLNGDGIPDLVVPDGISGLDVFLGKGDGTFNPSVNYGQSAVGGSPALLADVNGDGNLDAIVLNQGYTIFLGNGDGTLQPPVSYSLSNQPHSAVAGDFNGDGRTDLAFLSSSGNAITVLLGVLTPVFSISSSHADPFYVGQTGATYSVTARNYGPGTPSGLVTVTDTLPAGLTATAISGTNWNCVLATLTCTRSGSVGVGAAYPAITVTVNVTTAAAGTLTNMVSLSGGGAVPANASDPTTISGPPITVQTVPDGLQFSIDGGAALTAPQTIHLAPGQHTIAVSATQAGTPGTQYAFTGWSDSGSASHAVTVGTSSATYTATFKTQYQLTAIANPVPAGSIAPASGVYYDAGSTATLTATANSPYVFTSWTGGSTANPLQIVIDAPTAILATFNVPGFTCAVKTGAATPSVADVQQILNEALGIAPPSHDLSHDGVVNLTDAQKVIDAVLQLGCLY